MSEHARLRCRCGNVTGRLTDASAKSVNRVVCYCTDCQAFLHHLGRTDLLDAHAGTDIVQVAPGSLAFDTGDEQIVGLRLTPKGLYRWYARCCKTPLGNTLGPAIPFVGLVASVFESGPDGRGLDERFGKPSGTVAGEHAVGGAPEGDKGTSARLIARVFFMVLKWRIGGRAWPHPFFDRDTRSPTHPISVLTAGERAALRPLCGPHPSR